ncbi:hypothetical protein D1007_18187 [Hordeum vulgare]|nr:hypothetical protein D1007_18187 [Hordeum vulgare]
MGGWRDPCRLSTKDLKSLAVKRRVNVITTTKLPQDGWVWGKEPYSRIHPAPRLFPSQQVVGQPMADRVDSDAKEEDVKEDVEPEEEGNLADGS